MNTKALAIVTGAFLVGTLLFSERFGSAESAPKRLVRLAELEIDPAHLDAYRTALREEIQASIQVEPGVLTLYAVSVKDHPNQIRLFEIYANAAAYQRHLQSKHFRKYKSETAEMVKSLRLIET